MPGMASSSSIGSSQSSTQITPGMLDVYNQLLGMNQQNYGNVLNSYNQGTQNLNQNLAGIYGGYGDVQRDVLNTLGQGHPLGNGNWGVATPAAQAISQTFAQQRGATDQQMINAGLGNTTVRGNIQNQNALMAGQAYGGLGAQLAQTAAGYQANLGLAGLGARMQGAGMQAQMAQHQGQTLGGYHFANTAGGLTGGRSTSANQGTSMQNAGGYGGGSSGVGSGGRFQDWSGSNPPGAPWQPNPYAMAPAPNPFDQGAGPAQNNAYLGQWANESEYGPGSVGGYPGIAIGGGDLEGGGDVGSLGGYGGGDLWG